MGGQTPNQLWRYPHVTELFRRQSFIDPATDVEASLDQYDVNRQTALVRESGAWRYEGAVSVTATAEVTAYLVFNRATWGPGPSPAGSSSLVLPPGVYRVDVSAMRTSASGTVFGTSIGIELDGVWQFRRKVPAAAETARCAGPVVVDVGAPGVMRARLLLHGSAGVTAPMTGPRLQWTRLAR